MNSSKEQWDNFVTGARLQLCKQMKYMEAMKPSEIKELIEAARLLEALECDIKVQNAELIKRLKKARVPFD